MSFSFPHCLVCLVLVRYAFFVSLHIIQFASVLTTKYGRVVTYKRLETIEKFNSLAFKTVAVAYERCSIRRDGCLGEMVA